MKKPYQHERNELGAKYDAVQKQGIDPLAQLDSAHETGQVTSTTYRHQDEKVGRNDPCPCGSGKKYKKCCEGR
jgi:uncharacterized protein YecA (UPF0149 family)